MEKKWTIEKIKKGFDKFKEQNGRLPIAPEIDRLDYLPSSRQIQRRFGGLKKLRETLGYKTTDFGSGKFRENIANHSYARGKKAEAKLKKILQNKFHEVFVHQQRPISESGAKVDFYVYSPDGNFSIDVFDTTTIKNLQGNVNIKIDNYKDFEGELLLVVANPKFSQQDLDKYLQNKRKLMPENFSLLTVNSLLDFIKDKRPYSNPLNN